MSTARAFITREVLGHHQPRGLSMPFSRLDPGMAAPVDWSPHREAVLEERNQSWPELPGNQKWQRGVLAADGNIYGIPATATQVLRFTTPVPEGWTLDGTLAVDASELGLLQPLEALSFDADELRRVTAAAVAFCRYKEADSFAQLEKRASRLTGPMLAPQVPPCLRQGNTPLAHRLPYNLVRV
jgi:hypothetical protein